RSRPAAAQRRGAQPAGGQRRARPRPGRVGGLHLGLSRGAGAGARNHHRPARVGRLRGVWPGPPARRYWPCWLTERARRALWLAALFLWITPLLAARSYSRGARARAASAASWSPAATLSRTRRA